jgi:hypothetical protein
MCITDDSVAHLPPFLTRLSLSECKISESAAAALLRSEIQSLHLKPALPASKVMCDALHENTKVIDTNIVEDPVCTACIMRNRRSLHNWRCVCVLLASYRANCHSPIRDSILSPMQDVTKFFGFDR